MVVLHEKSPGVFLTRSANAASASTFLAIFCSRLHFFFLQRRIRRTTLNTAVADNKTRLICSRGLSFHIQPRCFSHTRTHCTPLSHSLLVSAPTLLRCKLMLPAAGQPCGSRFDSQSWCDGGRPGEGRWGAAGAGGRGFVAQSSFSPTWPMRVRTFLSSATATVVAASASSASQNAVLQS